MSTKVFFYTLRPFDEQAIVKDLAQQWGVEYGYTEAYPTLENAQLAAGYDAVSLTPCDMSAPMVQRFHDLGVKAICCRSIGYDHVDLEKARELGMKVSNVDYPPNGVANFAIMLMLMSLRKAGHILKRGEVQDYSLKGKIGRDISSCTVGVIGTGRIGQTVLKHLSGFGCSLLAYDLYPNQEVKKIAEYVPLETLLAESDVITLHTNATEENHHLLDAAAFAKMKPGVTIVNTARGKLIQSQHTYNTSPRSPKSILPASLCSFQRERAGHVSHTGSEAGQCLLSGTENTVGVVSKKANFTWNETKHTYRWETEDGKDFLSISFELEDGQEWYWSCSMSENVINGLW